MDERRRVAQMKRWLDEHVEEIEAADGGSVTFDYGQTGPITSSIKRFYKIGSAEQQQRAEAHAQ